MMNPTSTTNDDSITASPHKKVMVAQVEQFAQWQWLPHDLWKKILAYVQYEYNQHHHAFFKPAYARVNKQFNQYANFLMSFPTEKNYQLMVHCLIGKEGVEHLIGVAFPTSKNSYQALFNHISLEVAKIVPDISFEPFEAICNEKENFIQSYDDWSDVLTCLSPSGQESEIKREELLNQLFGLDAKIQERLMTLTSNKTYHYALLALAYIQKNKSLKNLEKLACLYAETGFLRGALFILEFCQGFGIWQDSSQLQTFRLDKNNFLLKVLESSVVWPPLGERLGRYMMDHYAFHYDLGFILKALAVCRTFNPAVKLLLLDVRHYKSPMELLKLIVVVGEHLENSDDSQLFPAQPLEAIDSFVAQLSQIELSEEEEKASEDLNAGDEDEGFMLEAVNLMVKGIKARMENQTLSLPLSMVTEIDDDEEENEEDEAVIEPVGDLQEFFAATPGIANDQQQFYDEAAKLYQSLALTHSPGKGY